MRSLKKSLTFKEAWKQGAVLLAHEGCLGKWGEWCSFQHPAAPSHPSPHPHPCPRPRGGNRILRSWQPARMFGTTGSFLPPEGNVHWGRPSISFLFFSPSFSQRSRSARSGRELNGAFSVGRRQQRLSHCSCQWAHNK